MDVHGCFLGGIYALIILAGQEMRTTVSKIMKGNSPRDLANLLRRPSRGMLHNISNYSALLSSNELTCRSSTEDPAGRMIIDKLIPAMARIRQVVSLTMPNLIEGGVVDCSDIRVTDKLFSVANNMYVV